MDNEFKDNVNIQISKNSEYVLIISPYKAKLYRVISDYPLSDQDKEQNY